MNKSEREKLACIVSEMLYSFDSTPQLLDTGKQLLDTFPSIAGDVENYRYPVAASNIVSCIQSAVASLYDDTLLSEDLPALRKETSESVEEIFDAYLENFDGDDFYNHLYELEDKLASSDRRGAFSILSKLFQSEFWQTAVGDFYDVGTPEFNYLTNTK